MGIFLVHGLVISTWVSRIPSIKANLRLGDGVLGLTLLGMAVGSVAAIPMCGWMVNRFGSRFMAKWTSVGFCLALILPGLAHNAAGLFCALLAFGAMAGAHDVAINAQAVGTEKLLKSASISRFHALFSVGGIVGASAGGFIAYTGVLTEHHLAAAAAVILIFSLWIAGLMVEAVRPPAHSEHGRIRGVPPALLILSAVGFCIFLSEGAIADWTAVYLRQVLHTSEGFAPVGYAVFSAAMAIFRLSGDAIATRLGRATTIRAGGLLAAAGLLLVITVNSPYLALVGFAATGAGFSSIIPLVFAAGGRVPGVSEGVGIATVSGLGYLGFLIGPPTIGFISELTSLRAGLFVLVLLSTIAALLVKVVERSGGRYANPLADDTWRH